MPHDDPDIRRIKEEFARIVEEVRPRRVELLISERFGKSATEFAAAVGLQDSYVSRMRHSKDKKARKRIGEEIAFQIERRLNLRRGWLDDDGTDTPLETHDGISQTALTVARQWQMLQEPERSNLAKFIEDLARKLQAAPEGTSAPRKRKQGSKRRKAA